MLALPFRRSSSALTSLRASALAAVLGAGTAGAQSFAVDPGGIPASELDTEQIDFADVDLDGDWDAAVANGGDQPAQQNELWVNQGGLQGGTIGVFVDETAARLPVVLDQSRDVEFADVDGDADPDLYVLRHSTIANAGSRWWINQGGAQGGSLGFYQDETLARFVGLGGPGSSIAPSQVLAAGGWIDWSNDGDFADLDGDGDLDLVHSSYGSAYIGKVPVRMFLNDGGGVFTEFNPPGFQLAGANIADGDPALWCHGVQMSGTTNPTGMFADIADPIVDFELADIDGDFDCDLLWGTRNSQRPRFFRNLDEHGSLAFRDESTVAFPPFVFGTFAFEQELGDLDGDGDLDLYGLNWGTSTKDLIFENLGGAFGPPQVLVGSGADEEEGDFVDYDGDGDLDLYVANFSGTDSLYENLGTSPITLVKTSGELPTYSGSAKDCEVADVDGDGDFDVLVAHAYNDENEYLRNVTGVPDTTPPRIPTVEAVAVAVAAPGGLRVRAHVLDNAPLYTVWSYPTELAIDVDGFALPPLAMRSSGGQVFRGELPANLVGQVSYRVRSTDGAGNVGTSSATAYTAVGDVGSAYGPASAASGFPPPTLQALSSPIAGETLHLAGQSQPGAPTFLGASATAFGPLAVPGLPNAVLNVDPSAMIVVAVGTADAQGHSVHAFQVPPGVGGATVFAQLLDLEPGGTFGSSSGLMLVLQ